KKDAGREYRRNGSGRKTEACAAHCGDAKNNCRRDWHSGFECEYKGNHKRKTRRGRTQRRHRRNRDCNGGSRMNPLSFRAERGGVEKSLIGNREMFRLRSTSQMRFFNTYSRKLEEFEPLDPAARPIKIYTCGPTVYSRAHIGNFRAYIFEDLLQRHLELRGYKVHRVMNITDVDDKTIRGAREAGVPLVKFTEQF